MNLHIKTFEQLSSTELYELLKARSAVFVVEQTCPYQDIDGGDYESLHVYLEEEGKLLAYLRCYVQDEYTARIGRVLTMERGKGLGRPLMEALVWNPTTAKPFGRSRIKEPIRRLIQGYVRTVAKYPQVNRFVAGQRIYSRGEDIVVCMTVKKEMTKEKASDFVDKLIHRFGKGGKK